MDSRDKIKAKVKALLSKTTENGASESEAISAINKAQKLMKQYYITSHDLKDPFIGEKCILKSIPKHQSGYNFDYFYNELSRLFDCEYYYTSKKIFFFGFDQDVELSCYFYNLIIKSSAYEINRYKKSGDYKYLTQFHHGRTLVSSFLKGFLIGIARQMHKMYLNRKSTIPEGLGLVVIEKEERVQKAFQNLGLNIKLDKSTLKYESIAFNSGKQKGNEFQISQGLNSHKKSTIKELTA